MTGLPSSGRSGGRIEEGLDACRDGGIHAVVTGQSEASASALEVAEQDEGGGLVQKKRRIDTRWVQECLDLVQRGAKIRLARGFLAESKAGSAPADPPAALDAGGRKFRFDPPQRRAVLAVVQERLDAFDFEDPSAGPGDSFLYPGKAFASQVQASLEFAPEQVPFRVGAMKTEAGLTVVEGFREITAGPEELRPQDVESAAIDGFAGLEVQRAGDRGDGLVGPSGDELDACQFAEGVEGGRVEAERVLQILLGLGVFPEDAVLDGALQEEFGGFPAG